MVIVGVIATVPLPVPVAALKSFTAVGKVVPAGTFRGYVMLFVGWLQPPPVHADTVGVVLTTEAEVESVWVPAVNVVDVIVKFQPLPLPDPVLVTDSGRVYIVVWSLPFKVTGVAVALVGPVSVNPAKASIVVPTVATMIKKIMPR